MKHTFTWPRLGHTTNPGMGFPSTYDDYTASHYKTLIEPQVDELVDRLNKVESNVKARGKGSDTTPIKVTKDLLKPLLDWDFVKSSGNTYYLPSGAFLTQGELIGRLQTILEDDSQDDLGELLFDLADRVGCTSCDYQNFVDHLEDGWLITSDMLEMIVISLSEV